MRHFLTAPCKSIPARYAFSMKLIDTNAAAAELGVSQRRVCHLIAAGRLRARRAGRDWRIAPADLDRVRVRKNGRPRKIS